MTSPILSAYTLKKRLLNGFRTIAYRGVDVQCNICGWKGSRFFDHSRCPRCQSFARSRLISVAIEYFGIRLKGSKVLHIAPNASEYRYFSRTAQPSVYDRLDANAKIPYINKVGDLRKLDIPDNTYDFLQIWHVLEHIPNDVDAMREMYRVLKPGGGALVSVPIHPNGNTRTYEDPTIPYHDFLKVHGDPDHCRSCGTDYYQRLESVGFKVKTLNVGTDLPETLRSRFRLADEHVCWLATKG